MRRQGTVRVIVKVLALQSPVCFRDLIIGGLCLVRTTADKALVLACVYLFKVVNALMLVSVWVSA